MRVLVTGGAGYIGSIATRYLLDSGYAVTVLDTLECGHRAAVDPRARLVVGDVGDRVAARDALTGCDAVVHFAGYIVVSESEHFPEKYQENNVARPTRLLDAMAAQGVRDIVFSSTAAVYGEPAAMPIDEDTPLLPINPYGESKLAFERVMAQRCESHGLRAIALRYFNVVGAWPDGSLGEDHHPETHIVPLALRAAARGLEFTLYGDDYPTPDGTCIRDYIHVVDLVDAHVRALEHLRIHEGFTAVNLGTGHGYSNREVVEACGRAAGRAIDLQVANRRPGDPARLVASNGRAVDLLDWSPRYALDAAVEHAWKWHQAHPEGFDS